MSTRANVILKQGEEKLFFYRHSDGYPEGTKPSLKLLVKWMKEGKIRNNLSQGSGWLIAIGLMEYNTLPDFKTTEGGFGILDSIQDPKDWKVGAFEPTTGIHGDIEFLYTIDLDKLTISTKAV